MLKDAFPWEFFLAGTLFFSEKRTPVASVGHTKFFRTTERTKTTELFFRVHLQISRIPHGGQPSRLSFFVLFHFFLPIVHPRNAPQSLYS